MLRRDLYRPLGVLMITAALASCEVKDPPPIQETADNALGGVSGDLRWTVNPALQAGKVEDNWLQTFNDPRLEAVVAEVMENNPTLEAAAAQVNIAAGIATQAGAALKPTIGLGVSGSTADAGGIIGNLNSSNVFLNVSWELDVWGRVRSQAAAAEAAFEGAEEDFKYARQSLAGQTAKIWYLATQVNVQKELAEEAVSLYSRLVDLVTAKQKVGKAQPQDLPLARANLAGAEANLRSVNSAYQEIVRSLELLLGRYPSAELETANEFVAVPPPVPAGMPSEILERRPDLLSAERRVAAAFYGVQQAEAARLPRISISGVGGGVNSGLADLLAINDPVAGLSADIFAPLYTGGALEAGVDIANEQQRGAMALYAQKALVAFKEVESALSNEQLFQERQAFQQEVVNKSQEAYRITKAQYDVGRLDLLTLLQTQASLLSAQSDMAAITNDRLAERINLHLALGGSFEAVDTTTTN